jgi:hypothetical protein
MDYAPFFAQSPQSFFHMSIPPTPSYSGDDQKLGPTVSSMNLTTPKPSKGINVASCIPNLTAIHQPRT